MSVALCNKKKYDESREVLLAAFEKCTHPDDQIDIYEEIFLLNTSEGLISLFFHIFYPS